MTGFDETAAQASPAPPSDANVFPDDDPTAPRPDDEKPPAPRTAAELDHPDLEHADTPDAGSTPQEEG